MTPDPNLSGLRLIILLLFISVILIPGRLSALETKTVSDGQTLRLNEPEADYSTLKLGKNVTLFLNGTRLTAERIEAGEGLRLTGFGEVSVTQSFETGDNSRINLSDISLDLGSGKFTVAPGSILSLSTFPILGGTVDFLSTDDGRSPSFDAPCAPLLGSTTVTGRFHTPEAYPEWFYSTNASDAAHDWGECINMAFDHSADGVVRLQSRSYTVSSTIYVPTQGRLLGTAGLWKDSSAQDFKKEESSHYGTKIFADHNGKFQSECLMLVNYTRKEVESGESKSFAELKKANCNGGEKPYLINQAWNKPDPYISNIGFRIEGWSDSELPSLCCILVAGGAWFDRLTFQKFRQCIVWSDHYADLKKVTGCSFSFPRHQSEGDYYLLDFNFLGDALVCEGNSFDSGYTTFNRHLRVSYCYGGNISSNIINGDMLISNCKGLRVSDNHMENGMQTLIRNSEVEFSNNFIEKGVRPSIVIENPQISGSNMVTLRNNCFLYYSGPRSVLVNGKWTTTAPVNEAGKDKIPLSDISDYDIELRAPVTEASGKQYPHGPRGILNLLSNYRYWITTQGVNSIFTSGISLCKSFTKDSRPQPAIPVESFNSISHIYSTQSTLMLAPDPVISFPAVRFDNIKNVNVTLFGLNSATRWYSAPSTFSYYYQIIWDKQKGLVTAGPNPSSSGLGSLGKITIPADRAKGVMFILNGANGTGSTAMVRMIRRNESTNQVEYCDLPVVATNCFYDNGPTIGAYKWTKTPSLQSATLPLAALSSTLIYSNETTKTN